MNDERDMVPVFYQLFQDIKEQIESGRLKPGDMIPSESQLGKMYGISRMTVRRGLALLIDAGLIETVHGKGNFVAKPRLDRATLFFNETGVADEAGTSVFKLLGVRRVEADVLIAKKLKLPEGTRVFMIKRLIIGEKFPVAVDVKYLPYIKGKPIVENEIEYADFPAMVARHTDVMIHRIDMSISATSLTPEEAELLKTEPRHPALCIMQIIYAKDGRPLGLSRIVYRGDMYELKAVTYPYATER